MHVPDGVLSAPVLIVGSVAAVGGVAVGLARMHEREMPKVAVLSSAFFAVSQAHIPTAGADLHLVLSGLMGVLLGWSIFPAVAVALILQTVLFHHGGWSTLGVNVTSMAVPGLFLAWLCRPLLDPSKSARISFAGFVVGFGAIVGAGLILALAAFASGRDYATLGMALLAAHLPLAMIEGMMTLSILGYLARVRPSLLVRTDQRVCAGEVAHA